MSSGVEGRLELVGDDGHETAAPGAVRAVAGQVGQGQVVGQVHALAPLAQAQPRDRRVDREHQGAVAVGGGAGTRSAVRARSRKMYTCIQRVALGRGGGHVLERQVASEDRISSAPAAAAPRAVATSPSGWASP